MPKAPIQYRGSLISLEQDGVKRPGPGQAPTSFRIWRAGKNVCKWLGQDPETFLFTKRSAELLAAAQAQRGLLYMFDFDHKSLYAQSIEDSAAIGWHQLAFPLDKDGNPECWAVNCEWDPAIKAGFEARPPKFRYFSPVWDVDPETNEIVSYRNCAVTNNPATQNIPSLAASLRSKFSKQGKTMDKKAALAALAALIEEPLTDKQKEAVKAIAAEVDSAPDAEPEKQDESGEKKPDEEQAKQGDASEESEEKKKEDEEAKAKAAKAGPAKDEDFLAELDRMRKDAILNSAGITGERKASLMAEPLTFVEQFVKYASSYAPRNQRAAQVSKEKVGPETNPALDMIDRIGDHALANIAKNKTVKVGE